MQTLKFTARELVGLAHFIDYVGKDDPEGYQFDRAAAQMAGSGTNQSEDKCLVSILSAISKVIIHAAKVADVDIETQMELAATQAQNEQLLKELEEKDD